MKIGIDTEACTGHGRCYTLAPSLFEADEEGFGRLLHSDVPPEHEAEARRAASSCPERAVTLDP